MFYNVTRYNNCLGTYFGRILNQQVLTSIMIPRLVNSVESNRLLFGGFPTRVIKFSNINCMGAHIMLQSIVNKCYYGNDRAVLWAESCRAIQGLQFLYNVL